MIRNFIWGSGPPVYIQPLRISGLPVTPVPKADICALLGCILTSCPAVKYHRPLNCPTLEIAVSLNADEIIRLRTPCILIADDQADVLEALPLPGQR